MQNHSSGSGTINRVTLYWRARKDESGGDTRYGKAVIRTYGTDYEGSQEILPFSWTDFNHEWTTNPNTGLL